MIDLMIQEAIRDETFPGIVLLVRKEGRTILSIAEGARRLYPFREEMRRDTLFDLASMTKPLATTVVALSVMESEHISPKQSIGRFLPELTGRTREITIHQLFTHTSGLPPVPEIYRLFETEDDIDREQALGHLLSLEPEREPGEQVIYSCTGYMILTQLLQRVTGETLDHLFSTLVTGPGRLRDLLFNPLKERTQGLRENIAVTEHCPWRGRWIKGEVHDENSYCLGGIGGNAGLFGTAESVMEFAGLFLSGGLLNGKRILSEGSVRMMTESQTGPLSPKRAFGFLVQDTDAFAGPCFSSRAFGHTGFTGTSLWIDPELGMEAVILTNRVHHGRFVNIEKIRSFRKRIHTALVREYF